MWAGLKKWAPRMRSAACVFLPMSEMSMVEVLEARMHWGLHAFSRSAKICCFTGMFSTAASITCESRWQGSTPVQRRPHEGPPSEAPHDS